MSNSESQHKKHPGGRKPKFDYRGEEFLSQVETYAKKGFTDREIAFALGLNPTYFYEMKSKYSEITDVLARGRATDQDGNLTGEEELQVSESELAPNLQAMSVWLYHHDEEWRKVERRQDEDADIPQDIDHGVSIDSWIKDKLK